MLPYLLKASTTDTSSYGGYTILQKTPCLCFNCSWSPRVQIHMNEQGTEQIQSNRHIPPPPPRKSWTDMRFYGGGGGGWWGITGGFNWVGTNLLQPLRPPLQSIDVEPVIAAARARRCGCLSWGSVIVSILMWGLANKVHLFILSSLVNSGFRIVPLIPRSHHV
jgi:hypothetical protein